MAVLFSLQIAVVSLISLSMTTNVICNVATMAAFFNLQVLRRKPSNLLILTLSCADFGVGLVQMLQLPVALERWPFGKFGCQFAQWLGSVCVSAGLVTTAAISIDRYLLISREYPRYLVIQSSKRITCTIIGIWLYGFVIGTAEMVLWDPLTPSGLQDYFDYSRDCRSPPKGNPGFALFQFTFGILCPVFTVEILSSAFFVHLVRKLRSRAVHPMNNVAPNPAPNPMPNPRSAANSAKSAVPPQPQADPNKRYKKSAKVLGAIVTVMNICTLPFVLYALVTTLCRECNITYIRTALAYILYLNSAINPFLYAATMPAISKFYKRILCRAAP